MPPGGGSTPSGGATPSGSLASGGGSPPSGGLASGGGATPAGGSPPRRDLPPRGAAPPRNAVPRRNGFKMLRVLILLLVLLVVALRTWQERYLSTRWHDPLYVAIYPIAADDSPVTRAYLAHLDDDSFKPIDRFFAREAQRYHLDTNEPFRTRLQPELQDRPPQRAADDGLLATALWSLRLRYWVWHTTRHAREPQDIRMFVLYHDPALTPTVPHSLGLTKGLIGVVYAFDARHGGCEQCGDCARIAAHGGRHRQVQFHQRCAALPRRLRRPGAKTSVSATRGGIDGG